MFNVLFSNQNPWGLSLDHGTEYKDDYLLIRSYNRVPGSASS